MLQVAVFFESNLTFIFKAKLFGFYSFIEKLVKWYSCEYFSISSK